MPKEPRITINHTPLTEGEAMTIRVALESFAAELRAKGLGNDEHGRAMTHGYLANIDAIRVLILITAPQD